MDAGTIVRSKAGRDRDRFFVVLECSGAYAWIADGKVRRVESPKKKKRMHLAATTQSIDLSVPPTNGRLRKELRKWNETGSTVTSGRE